VTCHKSKEIPRFARNDDRWVLGIIVEGVLGITEEKGK
jgi:hypothetical protein